MKRVPRLDPLGLLAWVAGLFILYGTWLPFQVVFHDAAGLERELGQALAESFGRPSLPDLVANVLLFLPFGAALAARSAARGGPLRAALLGSALSGAALSLIVETGQLWMPTRTTSASDIAANALGAALGAFGGWTARARLWSSFEPRLAGAVVRRPYTSLVTLLIGAVFVFGMMPFHLSLDVGHLKRQLKGARLIPFGTTVLDRSVEIHGTDLVNTLLVWGFFGGLAALAAGERGRGRWAAWATAATTAGVTSAALELTQLIVVGRTTDITAVVLATGAASMGALPVVIAPHTSPRRWATWGLAGWLVGVLFARWTPPPYGWPESLELHQMVPFWAYFQRTDLSAIADLIEEVAIFLPLGGLLAIRSHRIRVGGAALAGLALGVLIEGVQIFVRSRTPDVTDVLSATAGAALGALLWRRVENVWWTQAVRTTEVNRPGDRSAPAGQPGQREASKQP